MEFVVYLLYSEKFDKTYVGYTSSLIERVKSHNDLSKTGYTTKFRPWIVVYVEIFNTKQAAMAREKWLKSGIGRSFIKNMKQNNFNI